MRKIKSKRLRKERTSLCLFLITVFLLTSFVFVIKDAERIAYMALSFIPNQAQQHFVAESKRGPISDSISNSREKIEQSKLFVELSKENL